MKIEIRSFAGTAPRFSPELLGDNNAQTAKNISIKSGKIHPEKKFIIKYPDRDYVPGQINDDQYDRLYFLSIEEDNEGTTGTLKVAGLFDTGKPDSPGGGRPIVDPNNPGSTKPITEMMTVRKVDIPVPEVAPVLVTISSPFLDAIDFNNLQSAAMVANYGATSWKAEEGVATHIYGERTLTPITAWKERNNVFERTYEYNPWDTRIDYPEERS